MTRTIVRKLKAELQNNNNEKQVITIEINMQSNHTNNQLDALLDMMEMNITTLHNYKKKEVKQKKPKSKFQNSGEYV